MVISRYGYTLWGFFLLYNFVDGLTKRYTELFDEAEEPSNAHQATFGRKWKGYASVAQLANEDITKFDEILKLPLEQCLLYLAYRSDVNKVKELEHKQMLNRYKS